MPLLISGCLIFLPISLLLFRFIGLYVLRIAPLKEALKSKQLDHVKKVHHHCGYKEVPKGMNFQVHGSSFQLKEYDFNEDNDIRYMSAEDFLKSNDDKSLDMVLFKKQIFEEEKSNSFCSELSSVGERIDRFVMEEFYCFDSGNESSSDGNSGRDLTISYDYDNFKSDGYYGDCDQDFEFIKTSRKNKDDLVEEIKETFFSEKNEVEEEDDDHYNTGEESKNEELFFAKNDSGSPDISREANLEQKSETLNRDGIGNCSGIDLIGPLYVSYEQHHIRDDHDNDRKLPELVEEISKEILGLDFDEEGLDEIWEHQDLIEQLKIELKKVRAIGLPTILEESESSREIEGSKSFKIDDNLLHEDLMNELHKFYKCYEERMRKFDILNYQRMYATGFLHLNDPLELKKISSPLLSAIISCLSHFFLPFFIRKSNHDPSDKFIKELRCDFETVYVGQTCLSWEFLRWQYEKIHELSDSDSFISHEYNNVAEQVQLFKVTLQKFIENKSFQGPRVANYVKQRCILRNFLQLPVIKEDCMMNKMEKRKEEDVITREKLDDIIEEAMRVFWEFVKAEKFETPRFLKGLVENLVELHDPSDHQFMVEIQANLQKKEKKLKDLLKAGNCIVKKLKERQVQRSKLELFLCQVDLKLVSRVLAMSRITSHQLIWCQKKLSKITFSNRKVHREPSILLFPC